MKHILSLIAILAICSSFTFSPDDPAKNHGPLLVIDTSASNFGAVPNRGHVERTFVLSNKGDAPLHITQVRPTCGCTVASLADSIVAPGSSTALKVRLDADHRQPGNFYKTIFIVSNSRDAESEWLKFYGHFVPAPPWPASKPSAKR